MSKKVAQSKKVNVVVERPRSRWQKIRQHPFIITAIIAVLVAVAIFIYAVYEFGWDWTGFNSGYGQVTIHTPAKDIVLLPVKTLWDWLQLLIVPLVLAIGGFWLNQIQQSREQTRADKQAQTERDIAQDNQQEAALQEYINKMSDLLIDEELCKPTAKEETRKVARVRSLTVLPRLNGSRKARVLQFLYEAQLINKGDRVVDLDRADLSGADLLGARLDRADLSGVNLREANLFLAHLHEARLYFAVLTAANLFNADLSGANLDKAFLDGGTDLRKANLSGATLEGTKLKGTNFQGSNATPEQLNKAIFYEDVIMPDGSIHP